MSLTKSQTNLLIKTVAGCLVHDREPVTDFFFEELAFVSPNGGAVPDALFLKCLQTAIDAESSTPECPKVRPSMTLKEAADAYANVISATPAPPLPAERAAALKAALARRRSPEEVEAESTLEGSDDPADVYKSMIAATDAKSKREFEGWYSKHPGAMAQRDEERKEFWRAWRREQQGAAVSKPEAVPTFSPKL
jgi:hypothetical protein